MPCSHVQLSKGRVGGGTGRVSEKQNNLADRFDRHKRRLLRYHCAFTSHQMPGEREGKENQQSQVVHHLTTGYMLRNESLVVQPS